VRWRRIIIVSALLVGFAAVTTAVERRQASVRILSARMLPLSRSCAGDGSLARGKAHGRGLASTGLERRAAPEREE
jgi:hypothetical protein